MWETLGKVIAPIFAALLEAFLAYKHEETTDRAVHDLGAAETSAAVNKESADAADRMAKANAAPHARDDALGRLRKGGA